MAIEIGEVMCGPVTALALKGRMTLGEATAMFRNRIALALNQAAWYKEKWGWDLCLVLDLAGVEFVDSAGLGALVAAYTSARHQGARIKMANLTKMLREQLIITKLSTVFEVYGSLEEAKSACGSAPDASRLPANL
jgi:anti-sigma B factor antagonist